MKFLTISGREHRSTCTWSAQRSGMPISTRVSALCLCLFLFGPGSIAGFSKEISANRSGAPVTAEPAGRTSVEYSVSTSGRRHSAEPKPGETLFTKLSSSQTGVDFVNGIDLAHPLKRLYHSGFVSGGVAMGDVDGDGLPDLYFLSGPEKNRLFRQTGKMKFEDVTASAGVDGGDSWGTGGAMLDIDNDGDLDIMVCNYNSPNQLLINDGKGKFMESAKQFGLDFADASLLPTFADYDNDGDLDVFILTNRLYRAGGRPKTPPFVRTETGAIEVKPEFRKYYGITKRGEGDYAMDEVARPDVLFRNDGNGRFTNVTKASGIAGDGYGLSATWWDYDRDGWMDLYIANDFVDPDVLWRNQGDGTFKNVLPQVVNHTPWSSMGADVGDVNNDGRLDLIVLDMAATTHYKSKVSMGDMGNLKWAVETKTPLQLMRNSLFLNTGVGRMFEGAYLSGIASSDWSWAAKFGDYDQDGKVDLFISNGMVRDFNNSDIPLRDEERIGKTVWDFYEDSPEKREQNLAFGNRGNLEFEDVSKAWGLDHVGMSYAAAHGDLDLDGDLDLVVVNLDEEVSIYRNETKGNWLTVRLQGTKSNRHGVGAHVEIDTARGRQIRQMIPVSGYLSSNVPEAHFGLGESEKIDRLMVTWPGGGRQTLQNVKVNQRLLVKQDTTTETPPAEVQHEPMFTASKTLSFIGHRENEYDDFARQPLLPNRYSRLGPGVAWGDADGDGDEDVFIGAARGGFGTVFMNDGLAKDGSTTFRPSSVDPFRADFQSEDMGALFFDADSDGDLDLYVASGGYEYAIADPLLKDRLYLNQGAGSYVKAGDKVLPELTDSSSVVCGADFDRDGDVDLFVGGRLNPGAWPSAASSRLLINQSAAGKPAFALAGKNVAAGLADIGLVTSALWSDANGDGWIDLLVTLEWGPVKFFRNEKGTLVDRTGEAGLAERSGWWNSIAGGDIDSDGDIDYAVGNFGLNTKYHATAEKPVLVYYGDYDGSGTRRIVEAEYEGDKVYPIRGKSCSSNAMPHLKQKFTTYHDFAKSLLDEIYTPETLKAADRHEANTLESGFLINDGNGKFTFRAMPNLVQTAPVFGLAFADVDGDGAIDLYAVQNFYSPQWETGPMDGGLSVLLRGDGKGAFAPVWPAESGLVVPGDAKSLTTCDFNSDGRVDFLVANNSAPVQSFLNAGSGANRGPVLRLAGKKGNTAAVGALVIVERGNGTKRWHEIYAGSGYLSQSPATFSLPSDAKTVQIRWPDGAESKPLKVDLEKRLLTIRHP